MAQPTKAEREIVATAVKRLDKCVKADAHNRSAAIDDLKFANGDQWDPVEKKRRADKGRPALQYNYLQKFIDQVVGDMLHNSPQIKVRPVDSRADVTIAKIRQGIICNIEYLSNSRSVYGYAARQLVSCGYGAWRVNTRYTDENPFVQEAYIESVRNPFLVYMDPDAKDQFYADANYGFVLERMSKDAFKEKYPRATVPPDTLKSGSGLASEHWYDGETITVADYYTVETETVNMVQLENGDVVSEEEFAELVKEWREKNERLLAKVVPAVAPQAMPPGPVSAQGPPPPLNAMPSMAGGGGQPPVRPTPMQAPGAVQASPMPQGPPLPQGAPIPMNPVAAETEKLGPEPRAAKKRATERRVIRHRTISGFEILDGGAGGNRVAGKFIPIVLVKGKELNIEGKNYVYSLIRHAKDPQKLLNFWHSAAAESIALAPKAPWIGTAKQFEGYENDYAVANVENMPMLKYNADPDAQGPPQRNSPPQPPVAMFEQIRNGESAILSVIGMFNADIGAPGSEQTGAAITARQRPGDIGTYVFMSNMAGAVAHTGRILNDMIPEIYDSERDVRLRQVDETETFVPINTTLGAAAKAVRERPEVYMGLDPARLSQMSVKEGKHAKFNDITVGKYDVVVSTGPSYATQRQEAAQQLLSLVNSAPQQMAVALDLLVRNMDFKDADELEARLRKPLLSAGIAKPRAGETVTPPQPSPAMLNAQATMQKTQAAAAVAQVRLEQEKMKLEEAKVRLQMEIAKLQAAIGDEKATALVNAVNADRKHALEAERVRMERERLDHQREMDAHDVMLRASDQYHRRFSGGERNA